MNQKSIEAIEAIGKKIGETMSQQLGVMEMSGEFSRDEILACFNVAMALSMSSAIVTFSRHFPNYKSRDKYLNDFKSLIAEAIDKGKDLKETDFASH